MAMTLKLTRGLMRALAHAESLWLQELDAAQLSQAAKRLTVYAKIVFISTGCVPAGTLNVLVSICSYGNSVVSYVYVKVATSPSQAGMRS